MKTGSGIHISTKTIVPILLFIVFQTLYASFAFRGYPLVGDAADYASLIYNHTFNLRTTHIGFYILYYLFWIINQITLKIPYNYFLNLLSSFWGAAAAPIIYYIACDLIKGDELYKNKIAIYSSAIYGLSGLIWYNSEFAEVQAPMLFFLFLSLFLFLKYYYMCSGITLAFAALVSQACAPAILWFFYIAISRKIKFVNIIKFGMSFGTLLVLGIVPVWHDYLWGPRGVFPSSSYFHSMPILRVLLLFGNTLIESFWLIGIFVLFSLKSILKQKEIIWLSILSLIGFYFLGRRLAHVEYGFIWMPLFYLAAIWISIGFDEINARILKRYEIISAVVVGLIFLLVTMYTYIIPKKQAAEAASSCLKDIHDIIGNNIVFTTPHVGFVYAHENDPKLANVWDSNWSMLPFDLQGLEDLSKNTEYYVLDYLSPTYFVRRKIFSNSFMRRFISEKKIKRFCMEADLTSDDIKELSDCIIDKKYECSNLILYKLSYIGVNNK